MAFEVSQFSNSGLELLGQLSSHKSLVIKNILAAEKAYTADSFEQNIAWWTQETSATMAKVNAELASAGHDQDQARLTIKFTAKPGQQDNIGIKTVIVIACGKESGVMTDDIVYCGVSDPQGITVLGARNGGIDVSTAISLYFKFNAASSITLETNENPDFVLHSELDRYMTCHKLGDVNAGDEQEVRGNKYFQNGIMLNGQDGRPCIQFTDIYGVQDIAYEVGIHTIDRGLSLIAGNHLFNDTDRIFMMELDNGTALFDTTRHRASFYVPELYVDSVNTNSLVTEMDSIILKSNITPSDATVTIGTQDHPFEDIYSTIVHTTDVYCNYISVSGDITAVDVSMHTAACYSEITPTIVRTVKVDHDRIQGINRDSSNSTVKYATMWLDSNNSSIVFTCGGGETHIDDTTMKVFELNTYSVRANKRLYMDEGAQLKQDKTLILDGRVECKPNLTNQVMLAVPDSTKSTAVVGDATTYIADIPIGSIVLLYDQLSKFTGGALGLEPGKHIDVANKDIRIAMDIGVATETDILNMTWCGNHTNFETATGKKKMYAPGGTYVTLMGATATNASYYVTVLAMRIS